MMREIEPNQLNIACVVAARPNFMKMAPLLRALEKHPRVGVTLIHTGQHYDPNLSDVFFADLGMRAPDIYLDVGSGKHAVQTARVLERIEAILEQGPQQQQAKLNVRSSNNIVRHSAVRQLDEPSPQSDRPARSICIAIQRPTTI